MGGVLGNTPAVEVLGLTVNYADAPVLFRDFSLTVETGEFMAISGDSGCGKSTLLYCICGLIPGSVGASLSGEVFLFGKPVAEYSRAELAETIGVVFQNPDTQLFCDTVEDELAFGLENILLPREEMARRIDEALAFTGLGQYRFTSPGKLSGGQKQLVVFAAVLAMRPKILLLDEALSQLDAPACARMLELVGKLKRSGQTIIMVEHDEEKLDSADRVVRIGGVDL